MLAGEVGGTMKNISWLMVIIIALLLAGCNNAANPTATLKASATAAIPTKITVTPSMTTTFTPEPWLTLTRTETQTLKSFSTDAIGECRLPCWWGITPGVTTWEETLTNLKNKKSQMIETEEHYNATESKLPNELGYVWVYRRDDGKVNWIDISSKPLGGIQYYDLLTEYGQPSDIYLFTYHNFQTRPPWLGLGERPAYVILYYADKGILANYEFFGKVDDAQNVITVCPTPTSQELELSPEGTNLSFDEIKSFVMGISDFPMLNIEDSSNINNHDFYTKYKNKNDAGCFETPASLWP
jgi:hypothetical protein